MPDEPLELTTTRASAAARLRPDADGCTTPELAAQALISALESPMNDASSGIIAAGVSLLLGLSGWSRRAFE